MEEELLNYMGLVKRVAKEYTRKGMEYEDLVQEGFKGLSRAKEKFDPDKGAKFSTYAYYWIRGAIKNALKKRYEPSSFSLIEEITSDTIERDMFALEKLKQGLSLLGERERRILEGYFGLSGDRKKTLREFSQEFGISIPAVWKIKKKALLELKEFILKGKKPIQRPKRFLSQKEYQRKYRKGNELLRSQIKKWWENHPDYYKEWREKHPEYHREWRKRNLQKRREYEKEYKRRIRSPQKKLKVKKGFSLRHNLLNEHIICYLAFLLLSGRYFMGAYL